MNYPKVSIIILNWNGLEDTIQCLESLKKITYPNYKVIVVDNGSKGNDVDVLEKKYKGYIRLIRNKENLGFAEGNNVGIRYALEKLNPAYILVLNNDTIVEPDLLIRLVEVIESKKEIVAVQPKILKKNNLQIIDSLGQEMYCDGRIRDKGINTLHNKKIPNPLEIFGTCAAASLYRTSALREIGLFDKDFFAIYEDVDLSWRFRLAGYKIYLAPKAIVYHKRGISGKKSMSLTRSYYKNRNKLAIILKYYPPSYILKFIPFYLYNLLAAEYFSLRFRDRKSIGWLFQCFKERKIIQSNNSIKKIQKDWVISEPIIKAYINHIRNI